MILKLLKIPLFAIILLLATIICFSSYAFDPNFDFSQLKTFSMLGGEIDAEIKNPLLKKHIDRSIKNYLIQKGYQMVETGNADFSVSWFGAIDKKIHSETIRNYSNRYYNTRGSNYSSWRGYDSTYNVEYEEGTLIINIIDGKKRELIWRGKGKKYIGDKAAGNNISEKVNDSVTRIMSTFPPK